jgi:hypothetical protein
MKKSLALLPTILLLASCSQAAMPIFRNNWTTNVPGAYVRGDIAIGSILTPTFFQLNAAFTNTTGNAYFGGGSTWFADGIIVEQPSVFWQTVVCSNQVHSTNFMLLTPQWDDVRIPLGALGSPSSQPGRPNFVGTIKAYAFDAASDEEVHFELQLPHGIATNYPVDLHLHWSAIVDSVGANSNVVWGLEYILGNVGEVFSSSSTTTYITNGFNTARTQRHSDILFLAPGSYTESVLLVGRLFRQGSNGSDNYPEDAYGLSLDAHYPRIQMGSFSEDGDY